MHEYSIVNALLTLCENSAKENKASKVTQVEIKIGKLSGVEPHLLEMAFDTFKEETVCDGAKLVMHLQDIVAHCTSCQNEVELQKNEFICPLCGSSELNVLDGEEMYLMRLEME